MKMYYLFWQIREYFVKPLNLLRNTYHLVNFIDRVQPFCVLGSDRLNILGLLPENLCTIPIKKGAAIWAGELINYGEHLGYSPIDPK
jgi:hypothetical protein